MDQEAFNLSIRKFLKLVGINSQREIEDAVARLREKNDGVDPVGPFPLTMRLHSEALGIDETFRGEIDTERTERPRD